MCKPPQLPSQLRGYVAQILSLQADIAAYRRRQQAERRPADRKKLLKRGILPRR
jgi:hypothetical protein